MKRILLTLIISFLTVFSLQAQFSGDYDPANWTVTGVGGFSADGPPPTSLSVGDPAGSNGGAISGLACVLVMADGNITFDWSYATGDSPFWDPFFYSVNAVQTEVTDPGGADNQTGSETVPVLAGDVFCLFIDPLDGVGLGAAADISNFMGPMNEPPPPATLDISDPCACGNAANILVDPMGDATDPMEDVQFYAETVTIDAPPGLMAADFVLNDLTGAVDAMGNPLASITFTDSGLDDDMDGNNEYTASFWHVAGVGYTLEVAVAGETLNEANMCMELCSRTSIPTLSEWGLIVLALILMAFGSVKIAAGSMAFSGAGSQNMPVSKRTPFNLPMNAAILRKSILFTGLLALIGFSICFALYGAIFLPDLIGVAVAGPIFAYLTHLLILMEKNR